MSIEHIGDYARSGNSNSTRRLTGIMTFAEYQASIHTVHEHRPDPLTYAILGVGGEAGEVLEAYKKAMREGFPGLLRRSDNRFPLLDELGDTMWYVARTAKLLDVSLEFVARMNMMKLSHRDLHGKEGEPTAKDRFNEIEVQLLG